VGTVLESGYLEVPEGDERLLFIWKVGCKDYYSKTEPAKGRVPQLTLVFAMIDQHVL
jgi:hypothetical protein